jgi:hypothetical protein
MGGRSKKKLGNPLAVSARNVERCCSGKQEAYLGRRTRGKSESHSHHCQMETAQGLWGRKRANEARSGMGGRAENPDDD